MYRLFLHPTIITLLWRDRTVSGLKGSSLMHCFSVMKVLFDLLGVSLIIAPHFFSDKPTWALCFHKRNEWWYLLMLHQTLSLKTSWKRWLRLRNTSWRHSRNMIGFTRLIIMLSFMLCSLSSPHLVLAECFCRLWSLGTSGWVGMHDVIAGSKHERSAPASGRVFTRVAACVRF